jgi:curved DNA-binding protein
VEYKDYYHVLGVDRKATQADIKKAFRKLARQCHPDACPGDASAEERFKEINEAYEVLGDAEKRKKYDELGSRWKDFEQWQRAGEQSQAWPFGWSPAGGAYGQPGGAQYRTVTPEELEQLFGGSGGGGAPFSDFFSFFFGGGQPQAARTGRRAGARQAGRAGQDVEQPVQITLEEAYRGTQRLLEFQEPDGSRRRLEVKIPAGVDNGSRIRLPGTGGRGAGGGQAGNLYLVTQVTPHPQFERKGDDLYLQVPVDLYTALLGGETDVPTLKGTTLKLKIPPETQNGRKFTLRGQGMPRLKAPGERGDLIVAVNVRLPSEISDAERALFQQLAELSRKRH